MTASSQGLPSDDIPRRAPAVVETRRHHFAAHVESVKVAYVHTTLPAGAPPRGPGLADIIESLGPLIREGVRALAGTDWTAFFREGMQALLHPPKHATEIPRSES